MSDHHRTHTWGRGGYCEDCGIKNNPCECSAESGCARKLPCPGYTAQVQAPTKTPTVAEQQAYQAGYEAGYRNGRADGIDLPECT